MTPWIVAIRRRTVEQRGWESRRHEQGGRAGHDEQGNLVRTRAGGEGLVLVVCEHHSSFDAAMPLRLLGYMYKDGAKDAPKACALRSRRRWTRAPCR